MSKEYLEALEHIYYGSQGYGETDKYYMFLKKYLEAIDNANPSEALECLDSMYARLPQWDLCRNLDQYNTIKQALIKAEKEHNSVNLLMQELDCKDFADLRKYARCGYERLNSNKFKDSKEVKIEIPESSLMDYNPVKHYLKWEDLKKLGKEIKVKLNGAEYLLCKKIVLGFPEYYLYPEGNQKPVLMCLGDNDYEKQFFNALHLEVVENG